MSHHCHALACEVNVPPRMHMCRGHWAMVPRRLQSQLWANYRRGQERDMQPSAAYLRAAAGCVSAVAHAEGHPDDAIAAEVDMYESWARMVEPSAAVPTDRGGD